MRVVCDEVFGPVVTVVPFTDFDEALTLVNDSPYGLQAGVFTRDLAKAFKAVRTLRVGGLNVNDTSNKRADLMPYGGLKASGIGREGPRYSVREMTDERIVIFNL
jgi:acyl-CoA reductase-like NAD-dependent aldehyde dehydrogenase